MFTPLTNSLRLATSGSLATVALAALLVSCSQLPAINASGAPRDLGPVNAASFTGGKPAVVSIAFSSKRELASFVEAGLEVWYVDDQAKKAFGQLAPADLPAFQKLNAQLRLVQGPGAYNTFDPAYHTYEELKAELQQLANANPKLAKLVDIGDSWEKTQGKSDRDLLALRIGNGDASSKPGVIFCGNHHAREIVTPEIVLKIAHMLLSGYGKDAEITHFVDNRDIVLVPMVNPDGHKLASEGNDWRKNTDPTAGGGTNFESGPTGPGVDLNRNYGFKWGQAGASTNPSSATFRGAGPFSEPETQAVKKLIESRKWTFLMTYHSFSNLILWPWGYQDAPPPDNRIAPIGLQLGKLSGYKPEQSVQLYPTSGDTTDFAFGEHGILSYTTEIGAWADGFDPPYSKLPQFWKENESGARLLLRLADNPSHVFGPEVASATARSGQVVVDAPKGAVEVEAFAGKPGADGSGAKAPVSNGKAAVSFQTRSANNVVLVHGRDAKGNWGPFTAVFAR